MSKPRKKADVRGEWGKWGRERNIDVLLVGMNYRVAPEAQADLARKVPFEVVLKREPDNQYDPNAIKVIMGEIRPGMHIGYVSRDLAARLAEMIDSEEIRITAVAVTEIDAETGSAQMLVGFVKKISS